MYADLTHRIIGAAIEVHKELGPGLLESTYQACLAQESLERKIPFVREQLLLVNYKGTEIDCAYRLDFVVYETIILELKSVQAIEPVHRAQIMTYLRLSKLRLGLLINFNVPKLTNGIERFAL